MPLPKDENEMNEMLERAKADAARQAADAQKKLLEGTTFPSVEEAVRSAREAARKISEHSQELGELRKIKEEFERVKAEKGGAADDSAEVIDSMTDEESEALSKLYEKNEQVRKAIDSGGAKAQAEAIKGMRAAVQKPPMNPFKKKEKQTGSTADIKDLIKKALIESERSRVPAGKTNPPAGGQGSGSDKGPVVRGGISAYLKK